MGRKPTRNRVAERSDGEPEEPRNEEEVVEDEDEDEDEDDLDEDAEDSDEDSDEDAEDDAPVADDEEEASEEEEEEEKPKPVKKAKKAPAVKRKPRAVKIVRMKAVWAVFDDGAHAIELFPWTQQTEALALVDLKNSERKEKEKGLYYVQKLKVEMDA